MVGLFNININEVSEDKQKKTGLLWGGGGGGGESECKEEGEEEGEGEEERRDET